VKDMGQDAWIMVISITLVVVLIVADILFN
jgi:hypothetical protein